MRRFANLQVPPMWDVRNRKADLDLNGSKENWVVVTLMLSNISNH